MFWDIGILDELLHLSVDLWDVDIGVLVPDKVDVGLWKILTNQDTSGRNKIQKLNSGVDNKKLNSNLLGDYVTFVSCSIIGPNVFN